MSKFKVTSLNYVFSGEKEKIINLDIELPQRYYGNIGLKKETDVMPKIAIRFEGTLFVAKMITKKFIQDSDYDKNRINLNVTFVANVQEDDDSLKPYGPCNQFSMYDLTNGDVIHPLYDINDICLKSNIKKVQQGHQEKNSTENFIDIYSPQIKKNPIQSTKLQDYVYIVSEPTSDGPIYLRTDLQEQRQNVKAKDVTNSQYSFKLKSEYLDTYIYGNERKETLSSNFLNVINLSGIQYNYIYEIPLNANEYNDFPKGDMQCEILQTKNTYDSTYSMDMPDGNTLTNSRQYCGIGTCADKMYLKYYDNVEYTSLCSLYDENNIISNYVMDRKQKKYSYQKIETVESINRFKSNIKHKSNLYSVALRNTGLNTQYEDSKTNEKIEKLKNDIKNNIRDIAKKMCPVETQLFDIYFDGV